MRAGVLCLGFVLATLGCDDGGNESSGDSSGGGTTSSGTSPTTANSTTAPGTTADASSSGEGSTSSGGADSGSTFASSSSETGGSGSSSGGTTSGGVADGLGEIEGRCGVLTAANLVAGSPAFIVHNTLDFADEGFDYDQLTPGGQEVHDDGNLGGNSLFSEVISFDLLARCEGATLLKTEAEILYDDDMGTKTDLLVDFDGTRIGVSVTRGIAFPFEDPYTVEHADVLLQDKLSDIPLSSANVSEEDMWEKQILHVIAYTPMHATSLQTAYDALDPELQGDTIVVVTVTEGDDAFLYE